MQTGIVRRQKIWYNEGERTAAPRAGASGRIKGGIHVKVFCVILVIIMVAALAFGFVATEKMGGLQKQVAEKDEQILAITKDLEIAEGLNKGFEESMAQLQEENAALQEENTTLQEENAELSARIEELTAQAEAEAPEGEAEESAEGDVEEAATGDAVSPKAPSGRAA
jgi:DNA anti-recombination protein RmuC